MYRVVFTDGIYNVTVLESRQKKVIDEERDLPLNVSFTQFTLCMFHSTSAGT